MTSSDNSPLSGLNKENCKIIEKKDLYKGFFKMQEYSLQYQKFDGSWSKVLKREIFERGNAAAIIPYDPINDKVVLIEQFRVGAVNASGTPWLIEIVAGMFDKGESAQTTVIRELKEEAGLETKKVKFINNFLSSPGGTTEEIALFVGMVNSEHAQGNFGLQDENEDIRVFSISLDEAYSWLNEGKITNAITIIAIQYLMLNRDKLKKEWL